MMLSYQQELLHCYQECGCAVALEHRQNGLQWVLQIGLCDCQWSGFRERLCVCIIYMLQLGT